MKTRLILALLWMIRRLRFDLQFPDSHLRYHWIRTPSGGVEHWFESSGVQHSIADVLNMLGFGLMAWQLLADTELLLGRQRSSYNDVIELKSQMFACHGRRDLLIEDGSKIRTPSLVDACRWLIRSMQFYDRMDRARGNRLLLLAGEVLRISAFKVVQSLAADDARITELVREELAPAVNGVPDETGAVGHSN
jgi:hypothetical protein